MNAAARKQEDNAVEPMLYMPDVEQQDRGGDLWRRRLAFAGVGAGGQAVATAWSPFAGQAAH